jgi:hypothetical protein
VPAQRFESQSRKATERALNGGPVSQGSNVVTAALEADVSALRQVNQMLRDQLDDMRGQRDKWELTKNQHGEAYTRRPVDLLGRDPTADLGDAGRQLEAERQATKDHARQLFRGEGSLTRRGRGAWDTYRSRIGDLTSAEDAFKAVTEALKRRASSLSRTAAAHRPPPRTSRRFRCR